MAAVGLAGAGAKAGPLSRDSADFFNFDETEFFTNVTAADKRTVAGHTAVITLLCRHISHQSPGTGFRIRRFDAL
jgi:hypothetical protein